MKPPKLTLGEGLVSGGRATLPQLKRYPLDEAKLWLYGNGITVGQWLHMSRAERATAKLQGSPLPDIPGWVKELPLRKEGGDQ